MRKDHSLFLDHALEFAILPDLLLYRVVNLGRRKRGGDALREAPIFSLKLRRYTQGLSFPQAQDAFLLSDLQAEVIEETETQKPIVWVEGHLDDEDFQVIEESSYGHTFLTRLVLLFLF